MKDLFPEQWALIWEALQYQIASFEYLSQHDPLLKLAAPEIRKNESHFLKRKSELRSLARDIEDRMINLEKENK